MNPSHFISYFNDKAILAYKGVFRDFTEGQPLPALKGKSSVILCGFYAVGSRRWQQQRWLNTVCSHVLGSTEHLTHSSYLFFIKSHQVGAFFSPFLEAGKDEELAPSRHKRQDINDFSYPCGKLPLKSNLRKESLFWLTVPGHESVMVGRTGRLQTCGAAGSHASTVGKQEEMNARIQLTFPLFSPRDQSMDCYCPHLGGIISSKLIHHRNSLIDMPEAYFVVDSRSRYCGNW